MSVEPYSLPQEIDPSSFTPPFPPGVDPKDHLRVAIEAGRKAAHTTNQVVLVYQEEKDGEIGYRIRRLSLEAFHETLIHQCPKALDDQTHPQIPSVVIYPDGSYVVSKPGLCTTCEHYLTYAIRGHCAWLEYTPLKQTGVQ